MRRRPFVFIFLIVVPLMKGLAQSGGDNTYDFLNLTTSARAAALGGTVLSINDGDLNLVFNNPSLLDSTMHNNLAINYVDYFAGINYGYAAYARSYRNVGNFAAGIQYVNYGEFIKADETGQINGKFRAAEYAFNLMYSRPLKDSVFMAGVNLKPVFVSYESYQSFGLALDAGITYNNPDKLFAASLVVRNLGTMITTYYAGGDREKLPFEIQLGLSQKLQHAPFRFSLIATHLEKWDLTYQTESGQQNQVDPLTGESAQKSSLDRFFDKFMRHMIVGVEFIPTKSFMVRVGYNYKRRQEMKIDSRVAMVGFSWGFGIRISKFNISYGRATYHLAGASNHITLSTNLSEFSKKF